jgi:glycosyltransferase A (GT-A) superfamily protein (DUF2064 family)
MLRSDQTAILFFSRTPQEEACCKKIVSRRKTLTITHALQRQSLKEAQLVGLPVFHCTGKQQHGNSFGERLANAIEETFAKGYERLLVIGNDTPDLDAELLRNAWQSLNENSLVLGPSLDGGVYLIGLTAEAYRRDSIIQLAWETCELQETFTTYVQNYALALVRLVPLSDIDNTVDFWQFLHSLPVESEWRSVFKALFSSSTQNTPGPYPIPFQLVDYLGCRSLRAPPSFI